MENRIYINDFCEDLNYQNIILYIGLVNSEKLLEALERNKLSHCYRFHFATNKANPTMKNFIYVENCDLQDLDYPIYEYVEDGYNVFCLYEDDKGFYVKMPSSFMNI